jgi:type I restriction enzyme, R subunit
LARILEEFKDNWEAIYRELEKLRARVIAANNEPTYGLNRKKQMPFFRSVRRELYGEVDLSEDQIAVLVSLTQQLYVVLERELGLTGFWESVPARNKLQADIQQILVSREFIGLPEMAQKWKQIIARVMEIAEKNSDIIRYAS